jgi:hypothetical protein
VVSAAAASAFLDFFDFLVVVELGSLVEPLCAPAVTTPNVRTRHRHIHHFVSDGFLFTGYPSTLSVEIEYTEQIIGKHFAGACTPKPSPSGEQHHAK